MQMDAVPQSGALTGADHHAFKEERFWTRRE